MTLAGSGPLYLAVRDAALRSYVPLRLQYPCLSNRCSIDSLALGKRYRTAMGFCQSRPVRCN